MARPKKTLSELNSDWNDLVIDLYREGGSDVEIRAELNISNGLFNRWMSDEDEFLTTIKRGRTLSEAWWYRKGRENIENPKFNATLYFMNMRNRWGWNNNDKEQPQDVVINWIESPLAHQEDVNKHLNNK